MKLFDEIKPVFFIDNKMNNILNDINVNDKQKIRIKMQNKDYMVQKMHSRFRNVGKKEQYNVF